MIHTIDELLDADMSDEAAYHIIEFLMALQMEVERCCYAKARRYILSQKKVFCSTDVLEE